MRHTCQGYLPGNGIIVGMGSANKRWRSNVTSSLIGYTQTHNYPWCTLDISRSPVKVNGAPGNIQGNLTVLIHQKAISLDMFDSYLSITTIYLKILNPKSQHFYRFHLRHTPSPTETLHIPVKLPWIFPGAPLKKSMGLPEISRVTWQVWLHRAHPRLAPSQWEMSLQSNSISHWLGAKLESALLQIILPS